MLIETAFCLFPVCLCVTRRLAAWAWSVAEWGLTLNTARIQCVCVLRSTNTSKPRPTAPVDTNTHTHTMSSKRGKPRLWWSSSYLSPTILLHYSLKDILYRNSCLTDSQPAAHATKRVRETCKREKEKEKPVRWATIMIIARALSWRINQLWLQTLLHDQILICCTFSLTCQHRASYRLMH